jgi:hypothetical protein
MIPCRGDNWAEASNSIDIACPCDLVFSFVCDPRNDNRWLTNAGVAQCLTEGPIRAGSRFRQFPLLLGARIDVEWEFTAYEAPLHAASRSCTGPIEFERRVDCEALGARTRLTHLVAMTVPLPFVPVAAASRLLHDAGERALRRLKALLEGARPPGSGSTDLPKDVDTP